MSCMVGHGKLTTMTENPWLHMIVFNYKARRYQHNPRAHSILIGFESSSSGFKLEDLNDTSWKCLEFVEEIRHQTKLIATDEIMLCIWAG